MYICICIYICIYVDIYIYIYIYVYTNVFIIFVTNEIMKYFCLLKEAY